MINDRVLNDVTQLYIMGAYHIPPNMFLEVTREFYLDIAAKIWKVNADCVNRCREDNINPVLPTDFKIRKDIVPGHKELVESFSRWSKWSCITQDPVYYHVCSVVENWMKIHYRYNIKQLEYNYSF
jgi:hypothetical protein